MEMFNPIQGKSAVEETKIGQEAVMLLRQVQRVHVTIITERSATTVQKWYAALGAFLY